MTAPVGTIAEHRGRGDFLVRTGMLAAPLSLALMFTPYFCIVVGNLLAGFTYDIDLWALAQFVAIMFVPLLVIVAFIAIVVTLPVGGFLLWLCWRANIDPVASRWNAMRFGAAGGALVALIEAAVVLAQLRAGVVISNYVSIWGLAFGNAGEPTLLTWLKFAADLIVTVLIGAVSACLAWRRSQRPHAPTPA